MRQIFKPIFLALLCLPVVCHAWWNKDWSQRTRIVLNTSTSGAGIENPVTGLPVAIRLHSGNFSFADAKEDGSDLRFVAGDDKTPLAFTIEHFDGLGEMAVAWVNLPNLSAKSESNVIYAYYGNAKAVAEKSATEVFDASYLAVWHFGEKNQVATDATGGALKSVDAVLSADDGVLGSAAVVNATPIVIAANERLKMPAGSSVSVSMWVKPTSLDSGHLFQQGSLQIGFQAGKLNASVANVSVSGGELKAGVWQLVAMTVGSGKLTVYLDGAQAAQADASLPALTGEVKLGAVYAGQIDEVEIANVARSADYMKASFAAQGNEGKLLMANRETQEDAEAASSEPGYFGILVHNLTSDAWVVIGILMFMFVIAVWVMISKGMMIARVEKANRAFLRRFREVGDERLLTIATHAELDHSSLYRLYVAGTREVSKRMTDRAAKQLPQTLNGASIDAIKASIDADQVRENHSLNSLMVLLTIAISGGPFLGLLGTVVGVMITFAAIAAAGDVNVNAIAPGIAAALLATVAGLSVAIPALFGYNWLAAKIRNISSDMQIFVDELVTRVAETYGD